MVMRCSAGAATSGESSSSCFLNAAACVVAKTSFDGEMQRLFHLLCMLRAAAARFDIPSRVACA